MKLPWEKKHICWGIVAFLVIAASLVFFMIMNHWESVSAFFGLLAKSLRPITYGLLFAYLLNPLMKVVEKYVTLPLLKKALKKRKSKMATISRSISIVLTWLIAITAVYLLAAMVIPELYASIESLIISMPGYANKILEWASELLRKNPVVEEYLVETVNGFSTDITDIAEHIRAIMPNINSLITGVSSGVFGAVGVLFNLLVGVIVSVYLLKDKEKFAAQIKRLLYSMMPVRKANGVLGVARLTNDKFGNFIIGKIFDSMIIGTLCFVLLTIFDMPYTALVSVVVGVTNVIPFFGPFIGAIPSAVLILLANPIKCVTFIILILVLQQFDGNILGPKILGNTTGVSSFWVMFVILVAGGLFGFWGMLCGVPLFAVVYALFTKSCAMSLEEKGINYSTEAFKSIDHIARDGKPVFFKNNEQEGK